MAITQERCDYLKEGIKLIGLNDAEIGEYLEAEAICQDDGPAITTRDYMKAFRRRLALSRKVQEAEDEMIGKSSKGSVCRIGLAEPGDVGSHISGDII